MNNQEKGFSFIELLVVIGIIIVLGTVSVVALNDQRAKARDAMRISDIKRISTALEFYYSDEGEYPLEGLAMVLGSADKSKLCSKTLGGFVPAQTDCSTGIVYMEVIPSDPLLSWNYTYQGADDGYDLKFSTEKTNEYGLAGSYHAHSQLVDQLPGVR